MEKLAQLFVIIVALVTQATSGFTQSNLGKAKLSRNTVNGDTLFMAGFGGEGAKANKKNKKKDVPIKLKPKLQWDRYVALKTSTKMMVGLRLTGDGDEETSEWLSVGKVKSKDNDFTAVAVVMQRAIIAEHGKRLFPLQVSKKSTCEWGYLEGEGDSREWKAVDVKAALVDAPAGIEKEIGFEGIPDPATGFYCTYDFGRLKVGEETSFNIGEQAALK